MFRSHLPLFNSPPDAPFEMEAVRSTLGWQRTFRLPTPHLLVKACLIDASFTKMTSGAASDLRLHPGAPRNVIL